MAAKRTQPALVGNIGTKRGIVTKDGVYIISGRDTYYVTWREFDTIAALRADWQGQRAVELEDGQVPS